MATTTNFAINLHGMTYKQYADFVNTYSSGKLREAMKLAHEFILSWDYEQSLVPTKEVPYPVLKLPFSDAAAVTRTLFEFFKKLYDDAKTSDVEVKIVWDMDRYSEFDKLRQAGDVSAYEPMVHEIAHMGSTSPDKPLTLYEGLVMMKAISLVAAREFNGGN